MLLSTLFSCCVYNLKVARKQGWRPQAIGIGQQTPHTGPHPFAQPSAASGQHTQPLHVAQYSPTLSPDQPPHHGSGDAHATAVSQSPGSEALHSAEAAAARASQIAETVVAAAATAEEAAADAEDYETASKYAQEMLGNLGKPKISGSAAKRFYGKCCLYC